MKKYLKSAFALVLIAALSGCDQPTYDNFVPPEQGKSTLTPVGNCYIENDYDNIPATIEKTEISYTTPDGICTIEKKQSYYDVTLRYEGNDYYDVGAAYGKAILEILPDYESIMEPYIYENIAYAFPDTKGNYSGVKERVETLKASLSENYIKEMEGLGSVFNNHTEGFKKDGKISADEIYLSQMITDALRPTSCSSITVNGNKTETGDRMNARFLEWNLGTDNQILSAHCVLHAENGDKSYISVSTLGLLDILTAINDDGVMLACHDVGSPLGIDYVCEGRTAASYALRHCLENFTTAKDSGEYLVKNATDYTFCTNYLVTDKNDAFCAEAVVNPDDGTPLLRDSKTEIVNTLNWDSEDALCIVNSFVSKVNGKSFPSYLDRWEKYNSIFCTDEKISFPRFKELITCEKMDSKAVNFRTQATVHLVLVDYSTGDIEVIFPTDKGMLDTPEFINIGKYHGF